MHYKFLVFLVIIFFTGCSSTKSPVISQIPLAPPPPLICKENNISVTSDEQIFVQEIENEIPQYGKKANDLENFPQDISVYVDKNGMNQESIFEIQKQFEGNYYRPWNYTTAPICAKEAMWPIGAFKSGYGSNLKPHDTTWFREMELQSNFSAFSTVNKPAITTRWMNLRVMPTIKPLYKNPAKPGEGYPFDLLQNSSIAFNEPIFISHYSQDGAWAYVFTNNASGWVEANSIAILRMDQIDLLKKKEKLFITQDRIPLKSIDNQFITYSRIGMVLSAIGESDEEYKALWIDNSGAVRELRVPKYAAHIGIRLITKEELHQIGSNLLRNTYGWGGMFEERDCSSMIRDYFTPFGIWLPRNSAEQARKGEVISLKDLNNTQKLTLIKEKGIPFQTILYKKGHVLLYVGTYDDTVMVMHNIWGIRTKNKEGVKGRVVIGKAVISTLELGRDVEDFDFENMLLSTITSMNIFTKPSLPIAQKKSDKKLSKL
ncbi:MAG: SH3 domain-containing protein [Sulfuricurvum sp.]|uniref:C40 family peptidase n=1 Tax=Sulfuricurvum sp. TaxID=2025608 RepID=UPI00262A425F|nr:SH3 domain-containing C40 family peptidase [Sulfuricurvum sp.]MDD2829045.1 SH3 domain-containing protein [Sulfuricurvum sp.]MDD4949692.1 SH3 domain-containing protein [Sulfuricurvum sp.]